MRDNDYVRCLKCSSLNTNWRATVAPPKSEFYGLISWDVKIKCDDCGYEWSRKDEKLNSGKF